MSTWGPEQPLAIATEDYWYPINPSQDTAELLFSMYIRDSSLLQLYQYECDSINLLYDSTIYNMLNVQDFEHNLLLVYPNPFNDNVTIDFKGTSGRKHIDILDTQGRRIKSIQTDSLKIEISLSNVSNGIYFLNCRVGSETQSIKLLKR